MHENVVMRWKLAFASLFVVLILGTRLAIAQSGAPQHNLALSDFYAHDPFILADAATKTYYLYTAIGPQAIAGSVMRLL